MNEERQPHRKFLLKPANICTPIMSAAKKIIVGGALSFLFFIHDSIKKLYSTLRERETFSLIQQLHAGGELARALVH
jgi:hypothetical protein